MTLSYPDPAGALHVPYLDRQPWECATILSDGTLCGQEITYEPLRFCAECAGRFLTKPRGVRLYRAKSAAGINPQNLSET